MTANASSSSAAGPPAERPRLDLLQAGRFNDLAAALITGAQPQLLAPLALQVAGELPPPRTYEGSRRALAEGLAVANRSYGHPRADELAARLTDTATQVVVSGQQPGLFGGPLYALSKAVAAARWAAALEAAGRPAVAVFWVATEDHDYAEVSAASFPAPPSAGESLLTLGLGPDQQELLPVGMRSFGPAVRQALQDLEAVMPGERYAGWVETLGRWYRPEARFGEAFCRLLPHLLGERCPLLLDAMLPAVKAAQRPFLERLVSARHEVDAALVASHAKVEQAGFRPQVHHAAGASPLFLLRGAQRRRIAWEGEDRFSLRGLEEAPRPVSELSAILAANPGVISPGVLARPAVQDAILGTSLQVLGPAELAYMTQVAAVYPILGVTAPHAALRPQVLVLDSRQLEHLAGLGLGLEDLFSERADLERRLAAAGGEDFVTPVREEVAASLEKLNAPAAALDPNLEKPVSKTRDQILRALQQLGAKVAAAALRNDEVQRGRLEGLLATALPGGTFQERVISTSHFPGKYGDAFVEALWQQMDLDPRYLQVITP